MFVLPACDGGGGDDPDPGSDSGTTTDPGTTGGVTGTAGSIALYDWPADAQYPASRMGLGFFVDDAHGIANLAQCVVDGAGCVTSFPAAGASTTEQGDISFIEGATWYDASAISVGSDTLALDTQYDPALVYNGDLAGFGPGQGGIGFGGELAAYSGTADFSYPDPMVVTAPDPMTPIDAAAGETIDFTWTAGTTGDIVLRYGDTRKHLADSGSTSLAVDDLGLQAPFDSTVVRLARETQTTIDAGGNTVTMSASSEQWYYINYTNTTGWTALAPADTCAAAADAAPTAAGQYFGDMSALTNTVDLGEGNTFTGYGTAGPDGFIVLDLAAGAQVTATVFQQGEDTALYLMTDCGDTSTVLAGVDDNTDGNEQLVYTATDAQVVYLVIDSWELDAPGQFSLDLTIQ